MILIIICNECNEEFNKRPSRINKENFCSPKCFNINKSKKTDVYTQCTECKKDIIKKSYNISKTNNVFCSQSCSNRFTSRGLTKEKARNWKGGHRSFFRNIIMNEMNIKKCENCNYDEYIEILEIHHIDHNHNNNDLKNLKVLCPNCHSIEHIVKYGSNKKKPK